MTGDAVAPKRSAMRTLWRGTAPLRGIVAAGAVAGLISAGIGSRVVMRIIAVLNHDRDGVTTDARAIVGEISLGGTMSLVMLGAVAGVLGGLFYLGLRRWLWVPPTWRGPAFAAVTLLTVGHVLFDTANVDFQIFEPVAVVIALFAALFLMNGLLLVPLADRIHPEPAYPAGSRVPRAVAFVIALVCLFGLILMIDTFRTMINDAGTCYTAAGGGEGCAIREDDLVP